MTRLALFWMESSWASVVAVAPIQALLACSTFDRIMAL